MNNEAPASRSSKLLMECGIKVDRSYADPHTTVSLIAHWASGPGPSTSPVTFAVLCFSDWWLSNVCIQLWIMLTQW